MQHIAITNMRLNSSVIVSELNIIRIYFQVYFDFHSSYNNRYIFK